MAICLNQVMDRTKVRACGYCLNCKGRIAAIAAGQGTLEAQLCENQCTFITLTNSERTVPITVMEQMALIFDKDELRKLGVINKKQGFKGSRIRLWDRESHEFQLLVECNALKYFTKSQTRLVNQVFGVSLAEMDRRDELGIPYKKHNGKQRSESQDGKWRLNGIESLSRAELIDDLAWQKWLKMPKPYAVSRIAPGVQMLHEPDIKRFIQMLKKRVNRLGYDLTTQYCGEYCPTSMRPHWHLVAFLHRRSEKTDLKTPQQIANMILPLVEGIWNEKNYPVKHAGEIEWGNLRPRTPALRKETLAGTVKVLPITPGRVAYPSGHNYKKDRSKTRVRELTTFKHITAWGTRPEYGRSSSKGLGYAMVPRIAAEMKESADIYNNMDKKSRKRLSKFFRLKPEEMDSPLGLNLGSGFTVEQMNAVKNIAAFNKGGVKIKMPDSKSKDGIYEREFPLNRGMKKKIYKTIGVPDEFVEDLEIRNGFQMSEMLKSMPKEEYEALITNAKVEADERLARLEKRQIEQSIIFQNG